MPTRRGVLRGLGATAAVVGGISVGSTAVRAAHYDRKPEHVTITYNQDLLEQYRPLLVLRDIDRAKLLSLTGLVARSPEYESTMCVYWTEWSHQDGVSPFGGPLSDSHRGDHEPFYVQIDEDAGEVEQVIFSAYHWLAGRSTAPGIPMDGTHPKAHIVSPWHQYYLTPDTGTTLAVDDLTAEFPAWLENGLEEALAPGAVLEPWTMQTRESWWRDNTFGFSTRETVWRLTYDAGLFGADEATPVEV